LSGSLLREKEIYNGAETFSSMSIFKKGGKEEEEREAKDFLEEHERLKRLKLNPQTPALASPASPAQPQPAPAPAAPPRQLALQPGAQPSAQRPPAQPLEKPPIELLLEALRGLGMDVKPVEALKEYARLLDEKERELVRRIEELEAVLRAVRQARQTLKVLGV